MDGICKLSDIKSRSVVSRMPYQTTAIGSTVAESRRSSIDRRRSTNLVVRQFRRHPEAPPPPPEQKSTRRTGSPGERAHRPSAGTRAEVEGRVESPPSRGSAGAIPRRVPASQIDVVSPLVPRRRTRRRSLPVGITRLTCARTARDTAATRSAARPPLRVPGLVIQPLVLRDRTGLRIPQRKSNANLAGPKSRAFPIL